MSSILELLLVWLACLLVSGQSQELFYHDQPHETWRMTFNSIGEGNGLYLTPAKDKLIAVSRSGILRSFSPSDGSVQWTFSPPLISGGSVSCLGGLTFVETVASTYLAYMVVDTINGEASTRILSLDLDGQPIWESASVPGEGAGSPQASNDGRYLAITHNLNQQGHFSLFDVTSDNAQPLYQYISDLLVFDSVTPFSALGVYHSPQEGFYDSANNNGRSNTNDVFVFMTDSNTDVLNARGVPQAGDGQMYVFQFPADYFITQDTASLAVIPIGSLRGYQAKTAPVLADGGRTLYWIMVRGEFRGWVDQRFSRGHSSLQNLGRGDPPYIAGRASPTLGHNPANYAVYGPGASNVVFKADREMLNLISVEVDAVVSSRLAVTLDDAFVSYGTQSGTLVLASALDLTPKWNVSGLNPIKGDLAMDETHIFVADDQGNGVGHVVAFEMASRAMPPTEQPILVPTDTPAQSGGGTTTLVPTRAEQISTSAPTISVATASPSRSPNATDTSAAKIIFTPSFLVVTVVWGVALLLT